MISHEDVNQICLIYTRLALHIHCAVAAVDPFSFADPPGPAGTSFVFTSFVQSSIPHFLRVHAFRAVLQMLAAFFACSQDGLDVVVLPPVQHVFSCIGH